MSRLASDEKVPGGKYRLSDLQARIERALGGRTLTVKSLAREPAIVAAEIDDGRGWRDPESRVRGALGRMERLGLVRRVRFSEHRHAYALTDEGCVDLIARASSGTQS